MLQNIRDNSQGWIAKTIIGVIVALLALTGVDAIFQVTSNRQDAAEVNGQAISQNDLAQAAEMQRRQLMQRLGKKQLSLQLKQPLNELPAALADYALTLADEGHELVYSFDGQHEHTGIPELLRDLAANGIDFKDLKSSESSLEEIFVNLLRARA